MLFVILHFNLNNAEQLIEKAYYTKSEHTK